MPTNIILALIEKLGPAKIQTGKAVKERYCHIWKMDEPLEAKAVILPQSTADVSVALQICHQFNQPVVVHGGLTNLVGGTETNPKEVVISLEKMNAIEEVDERNRTVTVQAGVILEHIQHTVKEANLLFPISFGAKGSAQMGGIIATNAGGLRVLKFGMTRNLVLGLEVVLADGTIVSSMKKIIKDNSAYDIKQLFIGSEGTLGIITKAVLKLIEAPKSRTSAFVAFNEYDKVVDFLKYIDKGLAGNLSAFELIWKNTYIAMTSPPALAKPPLPSNYNFYVLLEGLGSHHENDQLHLNLLLENALEKELILDAVIAQSTSDLNWFWGIRENVGLIVNPVNHDQHFDVSLPTSLIGYYTEKVILALHQIPQVEIVYTFGHVADGNIHFVVGKSDQNEQLIHEINLVVYQPLEALGGSVSAEHGIGLHKKAYLHFSKSPSSIVLMKKLKQALDPKRILNRGHVFE